MAILKRCAVVVCCLLGFFIGEGNSEIEECQSHQWSKKHIELCHDNPRPRNDGPFECYKPHYGFVLTNLMIAPLSKFDDCGTFATQNYLNATCLRKEVDKVDQFDASVFDLLEKVSGKNKIDNNTVVDRFAWSTTPEKEGGTEDSSAFVSFQSLCKPAVRSSDKADNQVIRMCSKNKVANSIVILTLQSIDTDQLSDGLFRCRCTVTPSYSLMIKAFDIRLQRHDKTCSPDVSLKMYSGNQTFQDLRCDGLSARYGLEEMLTADHEVTLDLTFSNRAFPTVAWQQVLSKKGSSSSLDNVIVNCEEVTPLEYQNTTPTTPANEDEDKGTNTGLIVGLVVGVLCIVIVAAVIIFMKKRRHRQNLKAAVDNHSEASHEYAAIDETHAGLKPLNAAISDQKAPTPPPNHPRKLSEAECKPATEEDRRLSENRVRKLSEVNPVSKPPRSYSYSQDSAKDKEVAPRSLSYSQDSAKDKEVAVADQPSEDYDRLMHQGSTGRKKDARGDSQKSISDRKKNSYHHLDLGNNSAETKPLQTAD